MISKGGQELAFDQLSGGERVLVALAGDIARRLAIANPESNDPLLGDGVVLIDEIDLHLHPEWQAKVIPALRRTFPNVQLVVTTHSLVVLSYIPSECVRLLENFEIYDSPTHTEGREPNALASEIYGIPLRPPEIEAELNPLTSNVESIRYLRDGRIEHPIEPLQQDIDDRLNLNVGFLVEGRLAARDELIERLRRDLGQEKTWTALKLQRYLDERRESLRLFAYFGYVETLLDRWIAKHKRRASRFEVVHPRSSWLRAEAIPRGRHRFRRLRRFTFGGNHR